MPKTIDQEFSKGKKYCFKLLKIRARSTKEICERLKTRQYASKTIKEIIAYLLTARFLDDQRFTDEWIRWRLNNGYGKYRILFELKQKGIDEQMIAEALSKAFCDYDEEKTALTLAQKRAKRYLKLEPAVIQRRIYGYLLRKGFSQNISLKIVRQYDNI